MSFRSRLGAAMVAAIVGLTAPLAQAADVPIAAAANFTDAAGEIGRAFQARTGHRAVFSFGATGALHAQIQNAAPFQVFLSADQATVKRSVAEGNGVAGSVFTYAIGRIVLFSKNANLVKGEETLRTATFRRLAIANPATAPFGAAAVEAMQNLGVYAAVRPKIVLGDNITQTYQFIDTGNAELGFVSLSQVVNVQGGSRWPVAEHLYTPIRQDAMLTRAGANSDAAKAFLAFLRGPEAAAILEKFGYGRGL